MTSKVFFSILFISLTLLSCSSKLKSNKIADGLNHIPIKEKFLFMIGDTYTEVELDQKPEPHNGREQFYKDMYMQLRYPAEARNRGTQGSVIFEILIDKIGQVKNIELIRGLSKECDDEATKAIVRGCKNGFTPAVYKGEKLQVKYIVPVNFTLL